MMALILPSTEVSDELLYTTFMEGFSDYIIKIELTQEAFFSYFFGREGNERLHSLIAIDEETHCGLGVALGGIRRFDGKRTMRCGGMSVIPTKRGLGIASQLMDKHRHLAEENNCEQLFLEVIEGNDKAIQLYLNKGYHTKTKIAYYKNENIADLRIQLQSITSELGESVCIQPITYRQLTEFRTLFSHRHMNWQNEMSSLEKLNTTQYGVFIRDQLVGAIANSKSSIHFLAVLESFQHRGLAKSLIHHLLQSDTDMKVLRASFSDSDSLVNFYANLGFAADALKQCEMYLQLSN